MATVLFVVINIGLLVVHLVMIAAPLCTMIQAARQSLNDLSAEAEAAIELQSTIKFETDDLL